MLLVALLALVPMVFLTIRSNIEQRTAARSEAQQRALVLARTALADQERLIESTHQLLVALAQLPIMRDRDTDACNELLGDLNRQFPHYQAMTLVTPEGDVICSSVPLDRPTNVADRRVIQNAIDSRAFSSSAYNISPITGRPALAFAYPVLDASNELSALVVAGLDLDWLADLVSRADLPAGSNLNVVDDSGIVLARYPDSGLYVGTATSPEAMEMMTASTEGVFEGIGRDGEPKLYAFARSCCPPEDDIYVLVGIPKTVAFAEANAALTRNLVILGGVTLLVLGTALGVAHRIVLRPVERLLGVIAQHDAGNFDARASDIIDQGELGQIARALDKMADTRQTYEHERNRSEAELRRQTSRAEAMAAIAARLNASLELEHVLEAVCQETARTLSMPTAGVCLRDTDRDTMEFAICHGMTKDSCKGVHLSSAPEIVSLLKAGEVVVIEDPQGKPDAPAAALLAELKIGTFIGSPLIHEGELVGVLFSYTRDEARHLAKDDTDYLKAISDLAANTIANARLYETLKQEKELRAHLLQGIIHAQEEERKRVARELHDETIQGLIGLILNLDSMDKDIPTKNTSAVKPLHKAKYAAQATLEGVRRIIGDLRPSLLDHLGLIPAIDWYAEQQLGPLGVQVDIETDLEDARFPPASETALFRMAQEAITNIARHSEATEVLISLEATGGKATLEIRDNGRGFEASSGNTVTPIGTGLGLKGIRERVSMLGGELVIASTSGQGTTIKIQVPLIMEGDTYGQD